VPEPEVERVLVEEGQAQVKGQEAQLGEEAHVQEPVLLKGEDGELKQEG
jgi:hypothetical protein